ncbi:pilus assembly protein TadG-related protein [Paenarthrobacter sp. GOM3]|uniref:pilus assembly protein TadG-related protein n=1 Tax=Paenarthrobacter sp. GOM3 TaxID=2782567 RepID=UPI001BA80C17|nr:pilus assembly protein TadG-related protein [Paenarthrobacter sp. GOM3]WOH17331.1 pilus assembly protein TadG-related protein [Paenarthrobacter sp. GOM3]
MTVLIVGFVALSLLLATAVMAASAVYLEHKKLLSLADGAALAAADSYVAGEIGGGSSPSTALADNRVLAAAGSYLAKSHAFESHDHLTVEAETGRGPGDTAVVVLTSIAHPPVISFLLPDGIAVEAKSTARSRLTQ